MSLILIFASNYGLTSLLSFLLSLCAFISRYSLSYVSVLTIVSNWNSRSSLTPIPYPTAISVSSYKSLYAVRDRLSLSMSPLNAFDWVFWSKRRACESSVWSMSCWQPSETWERRIRKIRSRTIKRLLLGGGRTSLGKTQGVHSLLL